MEIAWSDFVELELQLPYDPATFSYTLTGLKAESHRDRPAYPFCTQNALFTEPALMPISR